MTIVRSSWKLTAEDEAKLWDLQRRLSDIDHFKNEPETVLRFQVAPQGYEHAESGFRKMLEWRKENHVDTILQDYRPPQDLLDNAVCTMLAGADKDGDPIYVERGGAVDVGALLKVYGHKELVKCSVWLREVITRGAWLDDFEKQQGRRIKGVTVLYDLKGLSSKHMSPKVLSLFHDVMMIASDYYPAPIKRVIVIQAVPIFRYIWAAVKHIFRESIRRKIVFAGKDYVDAMDQYIDRKVLPACIA